MSKPETLPGKIHSDYINQIGFDRAVQFGNNPTGNAPQAYPFFYNLIKYPYQEGVAVDSTGIYSVTGASAEGPDGLALPTMGILNAPIVMEDNANFHLLYMKFGAFLQRGGNAAVTGNTIAQILDTVIANSIRIRVIGYTGTGQLALAPIYWVVASSATTFSLSLTDGGAVVALTNLTTLNFVISDITIGSREYTLTNSGGAAGASSLFNAHRNVRIPYWTELDISVYMASSGARDLMGGFQREPLLGATEEQPIPLLDFETTEDGLGMVKFPFQLTKSATVNLRFRSRSAFNLRVYGHLFGYKITL